MDAGSTSGYQRLDYDQHARTVPVDDLWGQVRRTVGGRPVPAEQIAMIGRTIIERLQLDGSDTLLDLCCGNGALSQMVFASLAGFLGVDRSPYLVSVAQAAFAKPGFGFEVASAGAFAAAAEAPERFTAALCYGSFAYLSDHEASLMLQALATRFRRVQRVFLGNLPDADRAAAFYQAGLPSAAEMADPHSTIGVWRSPVALTQMAGAAGWRAHVSAMPEPFFGSHYRFDVLLTRNGSTP